LAGWAAAKASATGSLGNALPSGLLPYQIQDGEAPIVVPGMFGLSTVLSTGPKFSPAK